MKYVINPISRLCTANCIFYDLYSNKLTCLELAKRAEKSIYDYANANNKKSIIGGEITVLQIRDNGEHKWLIHSPRFCHKWVNLNDFAKAYKEHKIKIVPVSDSCKYKLDSWLLPHP